MAEQTIEKQLFEHKQALARANHIIKLLKLALENRFPDCFGRNPPEGSFEYFENCCLDCPAKIYCLK